MFPEHAWIIAEWLHLSHDNALVVGMHGIDQAVIFAGGENGGHQEQTILSSFSEFITQPSEFGRSRRFAPVCREIAGFNPLPG